MLKGTLNSKLKRNLKIEIRKELQHRNVQVILKSKLKKELYNRNVKVTLKFQNLKGT